ncbi:RNA-guided endonuclease InsQ/TnpB family protein [Micromonospora thermarum]|uniref:Transposase n=1 Tax=Micromonospora thermarum TaxID=2720024 RepID=A0ABX0Z3K8_9ACTN|nr:RNA-guided endonuclease TnpB family protein [Micromonospora thermarum]NJP30796.1 transposase [Micromonospora thermarum]
MLTGRRYLLAFTEEQAAYAERVGSICRAVWNTALEQRRDYRRRGASISYVEQARQVAEAKKDPACVWLADAPSHTLQQTLRDLDRACRTHGTWKVRWRSKVRNAPSFRFPDPNHIVVRRLNRRWGEVRLPKFGPVRFRWTRPLGGVIRNATVSRDAGRWHISFCVEDGIASAAPSGKPPIGVDRGVAVAVATSDGELRDRAFATPGEQQRIRRLQQRLARSRQVHGHNRRSRRRDAARAQLARLHARIRARRVDFAAQTAVRLVRSHGLVAVEDLPIKRMTASAKGTVERPGRKVAAKAGLNRAILSKGWGEFLLRLEHSARYHGATVVKVNPAYTSQTCHACGHVAPDSRESQAVFRCVACGHQAHADVNAAKNILAAGRAVAGRGDLAVGRSVKRQPPERLTA